MQPILPLVVAGRLETLQSLQEVDLFLPVQTCMRERARSPAQGGVYTSTQLGEDICANLELSRTKHDWGGLAIS